MFMGEFSHSLDAKGRLIMPAKYREQLGEKFVVTKGTEKCLSVYSMEEWQDIEKSFREILRTGKVARQFARSFFAGAAEIEIDKQGRILIPQNLKEYADLKKDVVLAGVMNRIEIWDKDNWEETNALDDENMETIIEQMAELGLNI